MMAHIHIWKITRQINTRALQVYYWLHLKLKSMGLKSLKKKICNRPRYVVVLFVSELEWHLKHF